MGMSENVVYPQWNSHLVGVMIINHWAPYFQTNPYPSKVGPVFSFLLISGTADPAPSPGATRCPRRWGPVDASWKRPKFHVDTPKWWICKGKSIYKWMKWWIYKGNSSINGWNGGFVRENLSINGWSGGFIRENPFINGWLLGVALF